MEPRRAKLIRAALIGVFLVGFAAVFVYLLYHPGTL